MNKCWANIDKSEGSFDTSLNVYFDKNNTGNKRSVKIALKDKDGNILDEMMIVQKPSEQVIYTNVKKSAFFTKQGCNNETEKGETLEYVVEQGKYTSLLSQSDADNKAIEDIAKNGQNWVNQNGKCITVLWKNSRKEKSFEKSDCNPDTEKGSIVEFVVEEGRFTSTVSQEDADKKASDYLEANGQSYANENGSCETVKWYNEEVSKDFKKNDCLVTEEGTIVTFTVPAGTYYSMVSQDDANRIAMEYIESEGQSYANANGECVRNIWYNEKKTGIFKNENCGLCKEGVDYVYTVEAGKYVYTTDEEITPEEGQNRANQKAIDEINQNGQVSANLYGECINKSNCFIGEYSKEIQKNDCGDDYTGSFVLISEEDLPGYPEDYVSDTQVNANTLVETAMNVTYKDEMQLLANNRGRCVENGKFLGKFSAEFTKDCSYGGEGATSSPILVTQDDVEGGPFEAYTQEEANELARVAVMEQGQGIANSKGVCVWTGEYSYSFTKECEDGQNGTSVTVTQDDVEGGPFVSNESKSDADMKAENAVMEQGQDIANSLGQCVSEGFSGYYEERFYRDDCDDCFEDLVGFLVTSDMCSGYPFIGATQNEANELAKDAVKAEGLSITRKNGPECTLKDQTPEWVDVEPAVTKCEECVSYKQQSDNNQCSPTFNQQRWVEGGDAVCEFTGTAASISVRKNDCEGGEKNGTLVEVTVEDLASIEGSGYPFKLCGSGRQEEANSLAASALEKYAQQIANSKGECQECATYSETFYMTCPSCQHASEGFVVTSDMTGGGYCPEYYNGSYEDALAAAMSDVKEQGQSICDKNSTAECVLDNTDPIWVNVEPAVYECQNGVSMQKQVNTNECYGGYGTEDNYRWVNGGSLTCQWTASDNITRVMTKECSDGGVGSSVTLSKTDMSQYASEFNDFVSFESQDAANDLLNSAYDKYGEDVANTKTGYNCTWTDTYYKEFTPVCSECYEYSGSPIKVTTEMIQGERVTSNKSLSDANEQAKVIVDENGQDYVNKNYSGNCIKVNSSATWSDTGSTRCNGCDSEKQQRDTNNCSSTYNQTRWISGGGRSCSDWNETSETYCYDHTEYYVGYDSCSGEYDYTYSHICDNCCDCGDYSGYTETGCNGNYTVYTGYDDCGNSDTTQSLEIGKCGYCGSYGSWSYDCSNGTKTRQDGCGNVDSGSMSSSEYCSQCSEGDPLWCENCGDSSPVYVATSETKCENCKSMQYYDQTNNCSSLSGEWREGGGVDCSYTGGSSITSYNCDTNKKLRVYGCGAQTWEDMTSAEISEHCTPVEKTWSVDGSVVAINGNCITYEYSYTNSCSTSQSETMYIWYEDEFGNTQSDSVDISMPANSSMSRESGEICVSSISVNSDASVTFTNGGSGTCYE